MKKFVELDETAKEKVVAHIDRRWSQLYGLSKDSAETVIKYLFLTNSGAAIAVLSFIGTSERVRAMAGPKIAMGFFGLGVVLIGALHAIRLHRFEALFVEWRNDVQSFFRGDMGINTLYSMDDKRAKPWTLPYVVGYASFACFIIGAFIGFCGILQPA